MFSPFEICLCLKRWLLPHQDEYIFVLWKNDLLGKKSTQNPLLTKLVDIHWSQLHGISHNILHDFQRKSKRLLTIFKVMNTHQIDIGSDHNMDVPFFGGYLKLWKINSLILSHYKHAVYGEMSYHSMTSILAAWYRDLWPSKK